MPSQSVDLITSALNAGDSLGAEQLCRAALVATPGEENLLFLLAMSLRMQQRMPEAVAVHAELTRLFPMSSLHWANYGAILLKVGLQDEALNALSKSIQTDPGNSAPKIHWGLWLIEQREYLAARNMLLDAFELDRESPIIRIHAARACCLVQDFEGAGQLLRPWRGWLPLNNDGLLLELAQVLAQRGDVPEAAELLEDLLVRRSDHTEARLLLATIYERFNRLEEAEAMASPVVQISTTATLEQRNEAAHFLATLASRRGEQLVARNLLEQWGAQDGGDYAHFFQLAGVYDKLGDVDPALHALREGHRLEAIQRDFRSPERFTVENPALESQAPRISAGQYYNWPSLDAPTAQHSPVFVVGFPRSGTTLLEQMLDAHPSLQSMDENPFFDSLADTLRRHDPRILDDLSVLRQFDCDELRKRYYLLVSERISRVEGTQLIDKNPLNMLWLPLIYRLFPKAKFILALRHPCDVILSCYMQNFRSASLAAACTTLERLAHAYVEVMTQWLADIEVLQPSVMLSRYEELVADPSRQADRLASFLGLEDAAPMLRFDQHARSKNYIGTPSYSQVIEPVNRKGLGRWHRYRREFEPLLPILEPMMRHWGYGTDI
jgi:tetratricopeptide (TPR) repeat protein